MTLTAALREMSKRGSMNRKHLVMTSSASVFHQLAMIPQERQTHEGESINSLHIWVER
jgi:hypothetical protein